MGLLSFGAIGVSGGGKCCRKREFRGGVGDSLDCTISTESVRLARTSISRALPPLFDQRYIARSSALVAAQQKIVERGVKNVEGEVCWHLFLLG